MAIEEMCYPTGWRDARNRLENICNNPKEKIIVTRGFAYNDSCTYRKEYTLQEIQNELEPEKYFCEVGRLSSDGRVHLNMLENIDL